MSGLPKGPVTLWAQGEDGKYTPYDADTITDALQNLGKTGPINGFILTGEPIELAPKSKKGKGGGKKKTDPAAAGGAKTNPSGSAGAGAAKK